MFKYDATEKTGLSSDTIDVLNQHLKTLKLIQKHSIETSFRKPTTPAKLNGFSQALLYRTVELSEACCLSWNHKYHISAIVLARSLFETCVVFFDFCEQIAKLLQDKDIKGMDALSLNKIFSTRNVDIQDFQSGIASTNILTLIEKLDRNMFKGSLKGLYGTLSEYSHPNIFSNINSLGKIKDGSYVAHFIPKGHSERILKAEASLITNTFFFVDIMNKYYYPGLEKNINSIVQLIRNSSKKA